MENRPSNNIGQRWTDEEEILLLDELSKNMSIESIAQNHGRLTGGINARRKGIAYKLHNDGIPMEEIITKTKLDENQIIDSVRYQEYKIQTKEDRKRQSKPTITLLNTQLIEIKNDIKELKEDMKKLIEMIEGCEIESI